MDPFGKSSFIFQPLIFRGYLSFWGSSQPGNLPKVGGAKLFQRSNPRPLTWKYSQNCSGVNHHAVASPCFSLETVLTPTLFSAIFEGSSYKNPPSSAVGAFWSVFAQISLLCSPRGPTWHPNHEKKHVQFLPQGPQFVLFAHPSCWRSKSFIAIGLMSNQLRIPTGFWGYLRSSRRVV